MRLLLDTHAFIWWLAGDPALSPKAQIAIADEANAVLVSAVSAWEISTKHRIGKLPGVANIVADIGAAIADQGFAQLPITVLHGQLAGSLPGQHRDPFDRMLIAQALLESLVIVTNQSLFDAYGAQRLW